MLFWRGWHRFVGAAGRKPTHAALAWITLLVCLLASFGPHCHNCHRVFHAKG